jgi:hypothetical protein
VKIPADSEIARTKLTHYLLVPKEVDDKSKFLAQAGFTQANPDRLESAIRRLIESAEAIYDVRDEYGDFYRVEGQLQGPAGALGVVTIWIIQKSIDEQFRL